jgi:hypothetical protein
MRLILKYKTGIFFAVLLTLCGFQAAAQTTGGAAQGADSVSLNIRYFDKKIYYTPEGPVFILITVTNNSTALYHFRLAETRAFSIDIDTRTRSNRPVDAAGSLERKRSTAGKVFFRDVTIESGESFSFVEDLRDYSKISTAGTYIVQVKLYPELLNTGEAQSAALTASVRARAEALVSNRLLLHIKAPSITGEDGLPAALDIAVDAVLAREKLPPDEVVQWTLNARQKSQWEKFFLYLDLEKMIVRNGAMQRQWRSESEEGRLRMLANYRNSLQKTNIDGDITSIPMDFTIENTNYDNETGQVVVLERFKTGDYIERKRFTYHFEKENGCWTIVDYIVINLGTE